MKCFKKIGKTIICYILITFFISHCLYAMKKSSSCYFDFLNPTTPLNYSPDNFENENLTRRILTVSAQNMGFFLKNFKDYILLCHNCVGKFKKLPYGLLEFFNNELWRENFKPLECGLFEECKEAVQLKGEQGNCVILGCKKLFLDDNDPKNQLNFSQINDPSKTEKAIFEELPSIQYTEEKIKNLCLDVIEILKDESMFLELEGSFMVVGDIHGDIDALNYIIEEYKFHKTVNSNLKIIFLGDYVDRGKNSIDVLIRLLEFKVTNPQSIYLIRGNHEFSFMNFYYGLKNECEKKYGCSGEEIFETFNNTFGYLSVCAVLNKKIFCTHGGIPAYWSDPKSLNKISKPWGTSDTSDDDNSTYGDTPRFKPSYYLDNKNSTSKEWLNGVIYQLMWNDPSEQIFTDSNFSNIISKDRWARGILFGEKATRIFLNALGYTFILRAHQWDEKILLFGGKVATIFSAPNYVGTLSNPAVYVLVNSQGNSSLHAYKYVGDKIISTVVPFKYSYQKGHL